MTAGSALRPDVLARLLLLQSAAGQLPDHASMLGFVCRGLEQIPGVESARHEPHDAGVERVERSERFALRFGDQSHGTLVIALADPEQFLPYSPYVGNLTFMITALLEERRHRELLEAQRREEETRTEGALRESEARYRRLAANLPDMIWRTDPTGRVLFVNSAVEGFLGYAPEEAVNKPMSDYFPPSSMQRVIAWSKAAAQDKTKRAEIIGDVEYLHKDGHRVPGELHAALVFDEDGRVLALEGVTRDITGRKRAEQALQEQAAQLREAQRLARIGAWEWTPGSEAIAWSEGLNWIVGRDVSLGAPTFEALGRFYTQESWERLEATIAKTLETGLPYELELEMIRADGSTCWTTARGEVVRGADGAVAKLRGTVQDISERKRAEKQRDHLEEQLRASQKMEAIGSLAGGVAHDFNNLVSVILSYADFASEAVPEGDPLRDDIEEIRKAGVRAALLTRQLLAFSRKQVLEPKVLNLNLVTADLEKMLRRLIGEDIELVHALARSPGLVKADPGQIEQVIMNLVVNARDSMPSGGTLTLETSSVELDEQYAARHVAMKPGVYVVLAISDTGCGMDDATQRRLFEPFFTTKEKGKGTGLGLSTAYGIIKQSGGDIVVYSELGVGTTVKVYLPRVSDEPVATRSSRAPAGPLVGAETVLVVEDEEAVRNLTSRILRAAGFKVLVASNGEEALQVFERHTGDIQLLVTDVVMPRMSGRQLVARLHVARPALRVLYMSGYTDSAILQHGVLAPGTKFIGKPFNAPDLVRKAREALDDDSPA